MDNQDIRTLKLLEEIDTDHGPSQRDLARSLNVSLGLVNSFIKRLAHKGYFKITTIPKNRVRYILTPKGVAEKTRLTYEFIHLSFRYYKESRKKLQKLFITLKEDGVKTIAFYGVNDFAEIGYLSLQEAGIEMKAIYDDEKIGERFLNYVVQSPQSLNPADFDKIFITVPTRNKIIFGKIISAGIPKERVVFIDG